MRILESILDKIKANNRKSNQISSDSENKMAMLGFGNNDRSDGEIFETLKMIWADNGDCISRLYAGTNSNITAVTKTGR